MELILNFWDIAGPFAHANLRRTQTLRITSLLDLGNGHIGNIEFFGSTRDWKCLLNFVLLSFRYKCHECVWWDGPGDHPGPFLSRSVNIFLYFCPLHIMARLEASKFSNLINVRTEFCIHFQAPWSDACDTACDDLGQATLARYGHDSYISLSSLLPLHITTSSDF